LLWGAGMKITPAAMVAATLAAGCYATTEIPQAQLTSIRQPLSAPRTVAGDARLGPNTEIRARLNDGSVTPWLPASSMAVAADGLVSGRSFPLAAATEARIWQPGEGAAEMLAATAPPGAVVTPASESELRLHVDDPRVMLPWVAAYATGARTVHQPPGLISFRGAGGRWTSDWIPGERFFAVAPSGYAKLQVAEGIPWRDVAALEVHNLEPIRTTFAVIGAPVAGAMMVLSMAAATAAIANGDDPTPAINLGAATAAVTAHAAETADAEADTGGAPIRSPADRPAVLVPADGPAGTLAATPLFTGAARRRDQIKLIVAGEAGVTTDEIGTGSVGAGVRVGDFFELTGRLRTLQYDDRSFDLHVGSGPIALLYGARLALHIDGDGDRRTAFVFGGEMLGGATPGGASVTQGSLIFGPRIGITDKTFASLLFQPSFLNPSNHPVMGQMMFSAEFGFDL
jgi:hypothetical protein